MNFSKEIEALGNDELLTLMQTIIAYNHGTPIPDNSYTRNWLDLMFSKYQMLDIRVIEMKLAAEMNNRFSWMVRYLMVTTPQEYIK